MRKHIAARRELNRRLAERETFVRCHHCKTVIDSMRLAVGHRFCSSDCEEDAEAFEARWAAAKARVETRR